MELAPMTKRDKFLLYVVLMAAFVVLYIRFLLIPGIENHQQAAADLDEARCARTTIHNMIERDEINANDKNAAWGALQTANSSFYPLYSSDELDQRVTGLELDHNLQPVSLTIGEPVTQSLTAYIASENAGQGAAPTDVTVSGVDGDPAGGNAILQQILAADLAPQYDQPGYFKTVSVSLSCAGENDDFFAMLDDLAANYPSMQLQSFSISTRSYAAQGDSASTIFNVTLNVILCDKEGVQP